MKNKALSVSVYKADEFLGYLNNWADFNKHKRCLDDLYTIGKEKRCNHITVFGEGYNQAVADIFDNYIKSKKHLKLFDMKDVIKKAEAEYNGLRSELGEDYPKHKCNNILKLFEVLDEMVNIG